MVRNHEDPGSQGSLSAELAAAPLPHTRCRHTCSPVSMLLHSSPLLEDFLTALPPLRSAQALLHLLCPLRTSTTFCGFSHLHPFPKGTNDDHPIKLCKHPVGPPESSRVLYFLWPSVLMSIYVRKEISPPTPKGQDRKSVV